MDNKTRLRSLREKLILKEVDGFLITVSENQRYIAGYSGEAATVLVSGQGAVVITDYRFAEQAREECQGYDVICRDRDRQSLGECFEEICQRYNLTTVGFESYHISHGVLNDLQLACKGRVFTPLLGMVEEGRYVKDPAEVALIREAARMGDEALALLIKKMQVGMSERDAARELEYDLKKLGSEEFSFPTILISGARSSLPHGMPSDKKIAAGDFVTIDFGAVVSGYRSDMTRTFVMGAADQKQKEIYETVYGAQAAALHSLKAGIRGEVPERASRAVLDASPYGVHAGEGLGHGVGLILHERPFMKEGCMDILQPGCVITIEPGIYIPGYGGVRIEDDVLITPTGYEFITHFPRELMEL